nr:MAG TPA: hypothetical protein [Caudoviricetes sp.]
MWKASLSTISLTELYQLRFELTVFTGNTQLNLAA